MIPLSASERAVRHTARRPLPLLFAALCAVFVSATPSNAQAPAAPSAASAGPAGAASAPSAAPARALTSVTGRVVRDGKGVPGASVELHRVASDTSGRVGATATGADGVFTFRLPPPDPNAKFSVFFATAMVDGVRYFGPALHPSDPGARYEIAAFDTTSAAAAVDSLTVGRRDVILVPGTRGAWDVAEVVHVQNPLRRTVVGPGGKPVFGVRIPAGATDFQTERPLTGAGPGAEDLMLVGDRVVAAVPITPGGRDMLFRYRLPAGTDPLAIPLSHSTDTLTLYVRQPAPGVSVAGLAKADTFSAEGDTYLRYTGTALRPDARVTVQWSAPGMGIDPRLLAGVLAGLVLLAGAWFALRRRPAAV